jgi:hypothetical protein
MQFLSGIPSYEELKVYFEQGFESTLRTLHGKLMEKKKQQVL